eukprot:gene8203-5214_t
MRSPARTPRTDPARRALALVAPAGTPGGRERPDSDGGAEPAGTTMAGELAGAGRDAAATGGCGRRSGSRGSVADDTLHFLHSSMHQVAALAAGGVAGARV